MRERTTDRVLPYVISGVNQSPIRPELARFAPQLSYAATATVARVQYADEVRERSVPTTTCFSIGMLGGNIDPTFDARSPDLPRSLDHERGGVQMHPRLVLIAILVLTGLLGIAPKSVSAAEPAFYVPDAEECAVVALINQFRADNGKQPLVVLRSLGAAAEHKAEDMAARNYFSHTEPPKKSGGESISFSENITNFGYTASGRGENLAAGYGSAQATFNQWEQSEPHRRNMLGEDIDFQAIGIGRAYNSDSDYGWYWTTTFGSTNSGDVISCGSNQTGRPKH